MEESNLYQYGEILCECGYDYNEDKSLWNIFDNLEYGKKITVKCPFCKKENVLELDYLYIEACGEELESVCMVTK